MPRRKRKNNKQLPCLPLRGLTIFPYMVLHFDVSRDKSIAALDEAMISDQMLFLATQKDTRNDDPTIEDIYEVGTVSRIKQMLKMPGDTIRVLVEGLNRGRIVRCLEKIPYFEVEVEEADDNPENRDALEEEALMRSLLNVFEDYAKISNKASPDTLISVNTVQNPGQLADVIAANILLKTEDKQAVLDAFEIPARLSTLYDILTREIQILEIEKKINLRVKNQMDKMSSDFRGDPASALLEVLDAEQNYAFRDHYLEIPFDLSKIMFLTTANSLETIPRALLDRLEVIRIAGYTDDEKINIAKRHLIPKQASEHGLNNGSILLPDSSIERIITDYTREAGVRSLERQIASICRKAARIVVETSKKQVKIYSVNLNKYLGTPIYMYDKVNRQDEVGLVTGLAWTVTGGETLSIEAIPLKGTGKLVLTGHLGEVMKESARAGFSYIRAKTDMLGISQDFYNNTDIHIHIPEGAIPKDGPSAGVAMTIATISALTAIPVKKDVAMTGEITLRGRVLAIGGLKEKVLAAHRAGISTVLIPLQNTKDLDEIPDKIKRSVKIITIDHMDNAIEQAFLTPPQPKKIIEQTKTGDDNAD